MRSDSRAQVVVRAAALLVLLAAGEAAAGSALARLGRDLLAGPGAAEPAAGPRLVDGIAGSVAAGTALLLVSWLAGSLGAAVLTTAIHAARSRPLAPPPGRQPLLVRRLAAGLLGVGLATGAVAVPASAEANGPRPDGGRPVAVTSLDRPAPG